MSKVTTLGEIVRIKNSSREVVGDGVLEFILASTK